MSAVSPLRESTAVASGNARLESRLWLIQRASAVVLGLCVVVHLITIIFAVRSGLSAAAGARLGRGGA